MNLTKKYILQTVENYQEIQNTVYMILEKFKLKRNWVVEDINFRNDGEAEIYLVCNNGAACDFSNTTIKFPIELLYGSEEFVDNYITKFRKNNLFLCEED